MRWWKIVGLAGLVGLAATGAVVVREERRRAYTPGEIRERLHARLAGPLPEAAGGRGPDEAGGEGERRLPGNEKR